MEQYRTLPDGARCDCNAALKVVTSGPNSKNPGRDFVCCPFNDRNDPGAGCSLKFCWLDEYPQGFDKKLAGAGRGRAPAARGGYSRGGYQAAGRGSRPAPARASPYAQFASAPQPAALPQPAPPQPQVQILKRQRSEAEVRVVDTDSLLGEFHRMEADLHARFDTINDLLVTYANDIVTLCKKTGNAEKGDMIEVDM